MNNFKQVTVVTNSQFAPIGTVVQDFDSSPILLKTPKNFSVKDSFFVDTNDVHFKRGQVINRKTVSTLVTGSTYSVSTSDYLIGITSLSYAPSIGLPRPNLVDIGKYYRIKDEVGGAATTTITIASDGEKTIDGASNVTITTNYGSKSFYTDGSNWFTI